MMHLIHTCLIHIYESLGASVNNFRVSLLLRHTTIFPALRTFATYLPPVCGDMAGDQAGGPVAQHVAVKKILQIIVVAQVGPFCMPEVVKSRARPPND